jgi:hypothetical protein
VKVVSDIKNYDEYESFDEDFRSVTPENTEEKAEPQKRSDSRDEESSQEDLNKKSKPSPKRQRRSSANATVDESAMPAALSVSLLLLLLPEMRLLPPRLPSRRALGDLPVGYSAKVRRP